MSGVAQNSHEFKLHVAEITTIKPVLQILLPFVFFIMPVVIVLNSAIFGFPLGAYNDLSILQLNVIPLCNPLITVTFVSPYRKAAVRLFRNLCHLVTTRGKPGEDLFIQRSIRRNRWLLGDSTGYAFTWSNDGLSYSAHPSRSPARHATYFLKLSRDRLALRRS